MTPSEWLERNGHSLVEDCPIARITRRACRARSRAILFARPAESQLNPYGCVGCKHGISRDFYNRIALERLDIEYQEDLHGIAEN